MTESVNTDEKRADGNYFINPYTFVPLPKSIERGKPRGHDSMTCLTASGEVVGYSGYFDWSLSFDTPLVLPEGEFSKKKTLKYPGSALRGTLRSLHETLSGGCLRVLDEDFVPIHREPMAAGNGIMTLAVVTKVDPVTERVTEVFPSKDVIWIKHDIFLSSGIGDLYSGKRVSISGPTFYSDVKRRTELADSATISDDLDGNWIIHLTNSQARRNNSHYYIAAGRVSTNHDDPCDFLPPVKIDETVWEKYVAQCEGNQDLIGSGETIADRVPGGKCWPPEQVKHGGVVIGQRRKVDGRLFVGDTVWLKLADPLAGESAEVPTEPEFWVDNDKLMSMATIWRNPGAGPVKDRIPESLAPCADPAELCPSCAVFGSIDPRQSVEHDQRGYGSHIRVGWASSSSPDGKGGWQPKRISFEDRDVPPLRSPKPSSGGFYLTTRSDDPLTGSTAGAHIPRAQWGSTLDRPRLAQLYDEVKSESNHTDLDAYLLKELKNLINGLGDNEHRMVLQLGNDLVKQRFNQGVVVATVAKEQGETAALLMERLLRAQLKPEVLAELDRQARRSIRGRKYYWMGQPADGGRQVARVGTNMSPVQNGKMKCVPEVTLVARVSFDNLDAAQLGWLLAAAQPSLMLGEQASAIQVGAAKPLGYGQAKPLVTGFNVATAGERYGSQDPLQKLTVADAITAAKQQIERRGLQPVHEALARVLAPKTVDADRIWYPTTGNFNQRDSLSPDKKVEFDWSFKWFAAHSGGRPSQKEIQGDMVALPDVMAEDQYLKNMAPYTKQKQKQNQGGNSGSQRRPGRGNGR